MAEIFQNTPNWYTVLAEISSCVLYIILFGQKIRHRSQYAGILALIGVHIIYFGTSDFIYDKIGNLFMAGTILLMYLYFVAGCRMDWRKRVYYTIRSLVLAEFLASAAWFLYLYLSKIFVITKFAEAVMVVLTYAASVFLIWNLERKASLVNENIQISYASLISCLIIGIGAYITSGLGIKYASADLAGEYGMALFGVRTLIDFAGVTMLYAHNMQLYNTQMSQENYAVHTMLKNQEKQYQFSQECINMVNMKYHDLKQQLNVWKMSDKDIMHETYMDELSKQMEQFDMRVHSGNQVIDIILTEKSLICAKKEIQIITVVDGKELEFMEVEDLCSIFGNALDNAIEYEEKIADKERRIIRVVVHRVHDFILLTFENYCEKEQELHDGLPMSTKGNRFLHGYGLKSIQYIMKKYDGQMDVMYEDGWFRLKMIIPAAN